MRCAVLLLLAAAAAGAPRDLRPREGSGWEGFREGSSVKTKITFRRAGRVPVVQVTLTTLTKIEKDLLRLSHERRDGLRPPQKSETVVPRHGEAAPGEKAVKGKPKPDRVRAAGREFDCQRTLITIKGPTGKRVVTEWTASEPRMRVKRLVRQYDREGELELSESHVLTHVETPRRIDTKVVSCQVYAVLQRLGGQERRGKLYVSREVPGGLVLLELTAVEDGKELMAMRTEALSFRAR